MTLNALECSAAWEPTAIIDRAKDTILSSNYVKVQEARDTVDATLENWVSLVLRTENKGENGKDAIQKIVLLWTLYANLEMELRQFKQATKVLEAAVACPVAGTSSTVWLRYTDFCIDRKKYANARKVFTRAVHSQKLSESDLIHVIDRFLDFIHAHVDPNMTLQTLQAQLNTFPQQTPEPLHDTSTALPENSVKTHFSALTVASAPPQLHSEPETERPSDPSALYRKADSALLSVDPSLAFVDKTGRVPNSQEPYDTENVYSKDHHFYATPVSLPLISKCPYLIFDAWKEGEIQSNVETEYVEQLSDILKDASVFQKVRNLRDQQRKRDREMLYRWQELIGMQLKEGSDLFTKHMQAEHGVNEPRELIALKNRHLDQRRELMERCQASQQQFIEISEMDRIQTLESQQTTLASLSVPGMEVTTDLSQIHLQRAIVALILEAEQLWRAEVSGAVSSPTEPGKNVSSTPSTTSSRNSRRDRRRDHSDPMHHSRGKTHAGNRGGRNGRRNGGMQNGGKPSRSASPFKRSRPRRDSRDRSFTRSGNQQTQPPSFARQPQGLPPHSDSFRFDAPQRADGFHPGFPSDNGTYFSNAGAMTGYGPTYENAYPSTFPEHRNAPNRNRNFRPSASYAMHEAFEYPRANSNVSNPEHAFRYHESVGNATYQQPSHMHSLHYPGAGNPNNAFNGAYHHGHGGDEGFRNAPQAHPFQMKPTSTVRLGGPRHGQNGGRGGRFSQGRR